jgi:hypothetical protein
VDETRNYWFEGQEAWAYISSYRQAIAAVNNSHEPDGLSNTRVICSRLISQCSLVAPLSGEHLQLILIEH